MEILKENICYVPKDALSRVMQYPALDSVSYPEQQRHCTKHWAKPNAEGGASRAASVPAHHPETGNKNGSSHDKSRNLKHTKNAIQSIPAAHVGRRGGYIMQPAG
jgi:hypothetical protein